MGVEEAAEAIGVTPEMVRRYIARKMLPAERIGKRDWAIKRADVRAFQRPQRGWPKGKLRKQETAQPDRPETP